MFIQKRTTRQEEVYFKLKMHQKEPGVEFGTVGLAKPAFALF